MYIVISTKQGWLLSIARGRNRIREVEHISQRSPEKQPEEDRQIDDIRNWIAQLGRLRSPRICSWPAGDPGEPMCPSHLSPKAREPGELMICF